MNTTRKDARRRLAFLAVSMLTEFEFTKGMSGAERQFWEGLSLLIESRFETTKFDGEIQTFEQRDEVIRELLRYLEVVALEPGMVPRLRK